MRVRPPSPKWVRKKGPGTLGNGLPQAPPKKAARGQAPVLESKARPAARTLPASAPRAPERSCREARQLFQGPPLPPPLRIFLPEDSERPLLPPGPVGGAWGRERTPHEGRNAATQVNAGHLPGDRRDNKMADDKEELVVADYTKKSKRRSKCLIMS